MSERASGVLVRDEPCVQMHESLLEACSQSSRSASYRDHVQSVVKGGHEMWRIARLSRKGNAKQVTV